jgi:Na+-translocating ferredoxin:NAD+ oxidoreductase subunit C
MMLRRPRGGLWLELKKSPTSERPIEVLKAPSKLYLPLRQFQGALPSACVGVGDHVYMGQTIADAAGGISCALHSPVSGVVESIGDYDHPVGGKSHMFVISNDRLDTPYKKAAAKANPAALKSDGIVRAVKNSGAVSLDDRGTPLWVKLKDMAENNIKAVVINAVETEPYICSSQKIIDENPDIVAKGLALAMKCAGTDRALLAISDDVPHEIVHGMEESARLSGIKLTVAHIPQKYPYGNERYLLRQLFPREIEKAGAGNETDAPEQLCAGFVSAQDCLNICRAVLDGEPQTTTIITVAGDAVENPQNLEVRVGSTVHDVLEYCGLSFDPDRVVLGSAMRGVAVTSLMTPITKSAGAVLALKAVRGGLGKSICINCGKCVGVCPQGLMPNYIAMRAVKADFEALRGLHINDCIECGSCAYICPGRMPIVELIKNIKKAAL